jgi:hypothetical protein
VRRDATPGRTSARVVRFVREGAASAAGALPRRGAGGRRPAGGGAGWALLVLAAPVESCDLAWNAAEYADRIPAGLLPIATTEGADKICLEIGTSGSGRVVYWDGYEHEEQKLFPVASGFEDFLNRLFTDRIR